MKSIDDNTLTIEKIFAALEAVRSKATLDKNTKFIISSDSARAHLKLLGKTDQEIEDYIKELEHNGNWL